MLRELASLASIGLMLAGLYAIAAPGSHAVQMARLGNAVTLTAGR